MQERVEDLEIVYVENHYKGKKVIVENEDYKVRSKKVKKVRID